VYNLLIQEPYINCFITEKSNFQYWSPNLFIQGPDTTLQNFKVFKNYFKESNVLFTVLYLKLSLLQYIKVLPSATGIGPVGAGRLLKKRICFGLKYFDDAYGNY